MPAPNLYGLVFQPSGRCRIRCRPGQGYTYFYRAVAEANLGRHLHPDEQVHHLNGDPSDDRIENLEVVDTHTHGALHGRAAWKQRKARWQFGSWSEHYSWCLVCGRTDYKHVGRGLCTKCTSRIRMRARRLSARVFA